MKKKGMWAAIGVGVYLAVLKLLVYAESFSPESSIRSLKDALWYSLVTLTTVGYGDYFPVTVAGRIIGGIFLFLSVGFFAVLVGAGVSVFFGRMVSALRFLSHRENQWYVFTRNDPESCALAVNLAGEDKDAFFIFLNTDQPLPLPSARCTRFTGTVSELIRIKKSLDSICVFCMGSDEASNYSEAAALSSLGCRIYCMTEFEPSVRPDNVTLFNQYDCCARMFWQNHPASRVEHSIVLLGSGRYAETLLGRALLTNIFDPNQQIVYHVYGDYTGFRWEHSRLESMVAVDRLEEGRDSVFFHGERSGSDHEILENADRIIICSDSDTDNLVQLRQLRRHFSIRGKLYVRLLNDIGEPEVFGNDTEVFTPELVMGTLLNRRAMAMHAIYSRAYPGGAAWEELTEFQRQSNIAAADHIAVKVRLLLETQDTHITPQLCEAAVARFREEHPRKAEWFRALEHTRWMRFHQFFNWQYAPVRNNSLRRHPLLVPYEALSPEEQAKDDYAWELIGEIPGVEIEK